MAGHLALQAGTGRISVEKIDRILVRGDLVALVLFGEVVSVKPLELVEFALVLSNAGGSGSQNGERGSGGTPGTSGCLAGAMKVIFLDIDGVLNCSKTPNPRKLPYIVDKKILARLKKLLGRTGAKVVLSSTWRIDPVGCYAARHWGVPFVDVCPDMPKSPRSKEILNWLAAHPRVARYAVIDDEDDELDELPLFQPSASTGLTMEIVRGVERYLAGKTEHTMRANVIERVGQNFHSLFKRDKS